MGGYLNALIVQRPEVRIEIITRHVIHRKRSFLVLEPLNIVPDCRNRDFSHRLENERKCGRTRSGLIHLTSVDFPPAARPTTRMDSSSQSLTFGGLRAFLVPFFRSRRPGLFGVFIPGEPLPGLDLLAPIFAAWACKLFLSFKFIKQNPLKKNH